MSKVKIKQLDVAGAPDGTKYLRDDGTWAIPAGTNPGHAIEDEGVARSQRTVLDFKGQGVAATDDAVNGKTVVTVPGMEALKGAWTALATYVTGDVVDFDKDLWRANTGNTNVMPSTSAATEAIPMPVANDGLWNLNGVATFNGTNVNLTTGSGNQAGNIVYETLVNLDGLDVTATLAHTGGADGFAISLFEPDSSTGDSIGGTAGSAGVAEVEGLHTIFNVYNTESIRVQRRESAATTQIASTNTSVPQAATQYRVQVEMVSAGNYTITVSRAGTIIHDSLPFAFPSEQARLAFGGGTGGFSSTFTLSALAASHQVTDPTWTRVYDGDAGGGGGGGGGHVVMDEGTAENQRTNLDFVGDGVSVADDPLGDKTIITIPGAGTITGRFRGHWSGAVEEVVWSEDFSDISGDGIPDEFTVGGSAEVVNAAYAALASGGAITTPPARMIRLNGMGLHSTERWIELNLNDTGVALPSKIRYWRTTSVEGGWDPLVIRMNGGEVTRYTGATPWGQVEHAANSGQTWRWTMHKDGSGNSGSDACAIALVEVLAWVSPNYQINDVVIHDDALWRCLVTATTIEPGTDVTKWEELPGGSGGGGGTLASLTDVDVVTTPPTDLDLLSYSTSAAKWLPVAFTDGSTPSHSLWEQVIDMPGDSLVGLTTYQGTWQSVGGVIQQTNNSSGLSARARFDTPVPPGLVVAEMEVRFDSFSGTDNRVGFLYGWPGTDTSGSFKVRLHANNGTADTIQSEMESTTALQAWAGNWAGVTGIAAWHKFRLVYNGNDTVQVWVDDVMIGIGTDVRLIKDGKYLGLFVGGAAVSIRNIKVWVLNPDLYAIVKQGEKGDPGPQGPPGNDGVDGQDALIIDTVNTVASSGPTEVLPDIDVATVHYITLDANCGITFPAAGVGKSLTVVLKQDATGGRLVTWPGTVRWPGGVAPTLSTAADAIDVFSFMCVNGSTWLGFVAGQEFDGA